MRVGDVLYTRSDGAVLVYDGERDDFEIGHIEIGEQSYEPMPIFSLLNRGYWEPTGVMAGLLSNEDENVDDVVKHLAGTEFDHDQSAHARGGKGASSDLLRYNPPEWQDKRGEEFQAAGAAHDAYRSKFLDSVFDNDPLMSNDSSTDGWHRTRDLYVAGREANEDVAVIVNRELRPGAVTPTGAEGGYEWLRVRAFDQMVKAATVKRDFEVFRAAVLTPEQVTALKSGSEFVDAGFQSSDLYEDTAVRYGFSRWAHGGRYQRGYRDDIPVLFRIRLKEGTNAVHVGNNEVVIQRNARVRITSDPADMGPAMRDGTPRREFDYIGDPDSGYVYSPNFVVVDVEVSK